MSFIGKRILVLGGNGYLGNYLASRFVQQKGTVMALSRYEGSYLGQDPGMNTLRTDKSLGSKVVSWNLNL